LNFVVAGSTNRRAIRWLQGQLPELVASGAISSENAQAIERHYKIAEGRSNLGFVLLAAVGSALIGAGIILLIAHNWDELNRASRSTIAFLPLIVVQVLGVFVLMCRNESQASRESVAVLNIAAVGATISLISQTYQLQGTFASFMCVWLLLSIPIVYIFRAAFGCVACIIGTVVWLVAESSWSFSKPAQLYFWLFLLALLPYVVLAFLRNRFGWQAAVLSICMLLASAVGLGFTAELTQANIGGIAFSGLFAGTYLLGMKLFRDASSQRLPPIALFGGIGVGVTVIVLSFQSRWQLGPAASWALSGANRGIGIAIQLFFPAAAILVLAWDLLGRKRIAFSLAAGVMPLVAVVAWLIANLASAGQGGHQAAYSAAAALVIDIFALVLGVELLARGVRANSLARANFGLLVIAALAVARFFDSDLSFVARGMGFIVVGAGFLIANVIFFRRKIAA
jgi:uncharacterized membrane protein